MSRSAGGTGDHLRAPSPTGPPVPLTDVLDRWAAMAWPGDWFVRAAAPSGRLALLYAAALGARAGHDYLGCEHLVAGALRAGAATNESLREVAAAAVAASQHLAEVRPEQVAEWFSDDAAADPETALSSVRLLPTLTPRAVTALRRARASASSSAALAGPTAVHVLSGVLEDPGIVAPAAARVGVDLEPVRTWAGRRAAWGPLLDLLEESD